MDTEKPVFLTCKCGTLNKLTNKVCAACSTELVPADTAKNTSENAGPFFYPLGLWKMYVLSVLSFGLFEWYWCYRNWDYLRRARNVKCSPGMRAWFCLIFMCELLNKMKAVGLEQGLTADLRPGWITFGWIILVFITRGPDPLWLLAMFSPVPLLLAQNYVNKLNVLKGHATAIDRKFSGWDWGIIVLGSLVLLLCVASLFLPGA